MTKKENVYSYKKLILIHWLLYIVFFGCIGVFGVVYYKYLMNNIYRFYIILAIVLGEVVLTALLIVYLLSSLGRIRRSFMNNQENTMKVTRSKNIKTRIFSCISVVLLVIFGVLSIFITGLSAAEISVNRATRIVKKNVNILEEKLEDSRYKSGYKKIVKDFDFQQDTFSFKNFSTFESHGNCFGIVTFEMLYNNKTMDRIDDKKVYCNYKGDLGDLSFDKNDMEKLFPDSDGDYEYNHDRENIIRDDDYYNRLIKSAFHGVWDSYDEDEYIKTPTEDLSSDNMNDIINSISYLQNNYQSKLLFRYCSDEYYPTIPTSISTDYKKDDTIFNIEAILDSLDSDKLVTVCVVNNIAGHAMLAYGYEIIDDNNIKVYISDPNFTLYSGDINDREKNINDDIINNSYILFTKDILKDNWSYIYRPSIEGIDPYDDSGYSFFNSFLPGTIMEIYREI